MCLVDLDCDETVDVFVEILKETDKAILATNGGPKVWLPKSQIEGDAGYEPGEACEITMPVWLAEDKGLV